MKWRRDPIQRADAEWRRRLYIIIFEAETPAGRLFDVVLLIIILLSIVVVSLESVASIDSYFHTFLQALEWLLTLAFTVEYTLRLLCVRRPLRYALSFFGLVDLLSILPTYLSLVFTGAQSLLMIRTLRLLRVFRVLKLAQFMSEAQTLVGALRASRSKIAVFLMAVLTLVVISGTLMYLVESDESGFTSIPRSMYWAIVTMTTVGYGDIAPRTALGQFFAALLMISGYAIIAVPTGIVSAELVNTSHNRPSLSTRTCSHCAVEGHEAEANYCRHCGNPLEVAPEEVSRDDA
ncbi:MAG: ion transporter [Nannocystaceae bacterium]